MTVSAPRYHVNAWYSWADVGAGRKAINRDYQTRRNALAAARASDCPLVDVLEAGRGVIADRELIHHPLMSPQGLATWTAHEIAPD